MMKESILQPPHSIGMPVANLVATSVEEDDAALVTACQSGDQDAFAVLLQRHQRLVFSLVYRILQQYDEANEVTQDVFVAAWQALPSFRGDARFSTWLYRIAYNCALKQLEQRKKDWALQNAMRAEPIKSEEQESVELAETHDRQELVREFLSNLPAKYRAVLVLRHLQDMTYEEMAEVLTVPIGTIKTQLFRARNLLKERIEAFEHEWKTRG